MLQYISQNDISQNDFCGLDGRTVCGKKGIYQAAARDLFRNPQRPQAHTQRDGQLVSDPNCKSRISIGVFSLNPEGVIAVGYNCIRFHVIRNPLF